MVHDHDLDLLWPFLVVWACRYWTVAVVPFTIRVARVDDAVTCPARHAVAGIPAELGTYGGGEDTGFHVWGARVVSGEFAAGLADALLTGRLMVLLSVRKEFR